jgi:uncharacterized membrane protein
MDFMWIVWFLVVVLLIGLGYVIISRLVMPAIPATMQVWVWAVIGIVLLIMLVYFASQFMGGGHFHMHGTG